ncbi:G5 domain-containing protein [Hutsoniella sourekii]
MQKQVKYSIRKLSVGVASVAVGAFLVGQTADVQAQEVISNGPDSQPIPGAAATFETPSEVAEETVSPYEGAEVISHDPNVDPIPGAAATFTPAMELTPAEEVAATPEEATPSPEVIKRDPDADPIPGAAATFTPAMELTPAEEVPGKEPIPGAAATFDKEGDGLAENPKTEDQAGPETEEVPGKEPIPGAAATFDKEGEGVAENLKMEDQSSPVAEEVPGKEPIPGAAATFIPATELTPANEVPGKDAISGAAASHSPLVELTPAKKITSPSDTTTDPTSSNEVIKRDPNVSPRPGAAATFIPATELIPANEVPGKDPISGAAASHSPLVELTPAKKITKPSDTTTDPTSSNEVIKRDPNVSPRPGAATDKNRPTKESAIITIERGVTEREISFSTIFKPDQALEKGKRQVVQEGQPGILRITEIETLEPGKQAVISYKEERIKEPVDRIIHIGNAEPKQGASYKDMELQKVELDFDTEIIGENPQLKKGEKEIVRPGSKGLKLIKTFTPVTNGIEGTRTSIEQIIKQPVNQQIRLGTYVEPAKRQYKYTTESEQLNYSTVYRVNPDLMEDQTIKVQEGAYGKITRTYRQEIDAQGQAIGERELESVNRIEPVNQIFERGIKKAVEWKHTTQEEELNYSTIFKANPELDEGTDRLVQEGAYGKIIRHYQQAFDASGKAVGPKILAGEFHLPPVDRIIERGTKTKQTHTPVSYLEIIEKVADLQFSTDIHSNDQLPEGQRRIVRPGKLGYIENIYQQPVDQDGKPVGQRILKDTRRVEPINQIIEIGTKQAEGPKASYIEVVELVKETDYSTDIRGNKDLPEGERRIVRPGVKGRVENVYLQPINEKGEPVGDRIFKRTREVAPVNQILEIGTKKADPRPSKPQPSKPNPVNPSTEDPHAGGRVAPSDHDLTGPGRNEPRRPESSTKSRPSHTTLANDPSDAVDPSRGLATDPVYPVLQAGQLPATGEVASSMVTYLGTTLGLAGLAGLVSKRRKK